MASKKTWNKILQIREFSAIKQLSEDNQDNEVHINITSESYIDVHNQYNNTLKCTIKIMCILHLFEELTLILQIFINKKSNIASEANFPEMCVSQSFIYKNA